jgi:hypothetical protein
MAEAIEHMALYNFKPLSPAEQLSVEQWPAARAILDRQEAMLNWLMVVGHCTSGTRGQVALMSQQKAVDPQQLWVTNRGVPHISRCTCSNCNRYSH